jgi:hypothetical protein
MFLSVFDIFKVGVGPSSSHTVGPMVAAGRFLAALRDGTERIPGAGPPARLGCRLHGSLAFTGKGHATDRAVILGLAGFDPADFDAGRAAEALEKVAASGRIAPPGLPEMAFDAARDLAFDYGPPLPGHANGLVLSAWDGRGKGGRMPKTGRGMWGNPFKVGIDGTPEECIQKFERYLLEDRPDLVALIPTDIKGKVLGCTCKPKPCHGDALARLADSSVPIRREAS